MHTKKKMVINKEKTKTLNNIKPIENTNKNPQSYQVADETELGYKGH